MSSLKPETAKAIDWGDLKDELELTPEEQVSVEEQTATMLAEVRAHRLAEVRKRRHMTQADVAKSLGITQGRVSQIEKGAVTRTEVETLAACVAALGGRLKIVADFGDESLVLG
ncbi:XRE family transcriptional regulator [Streptomyces beihaiensis]|uniref:Helix-turn-helix domain-containing protein n=1 Tax=Streptomyces beihaiensis TaxID=2984495 RepID=A0ABT3TQ71_9ACTN|nr:XRE family transcriptional regulator [Streptomyces beihaiensis]MCX3059147.1 helix-turn-helix domain-containing protein [Streptomyces beihaiensis]